MSYFACQIGPRVSYWFQVWPSTSPALPPACRTPSNRSHALVSYAPIVDGTVVVTHGTKSCCKLASLDSLRPLLGTLKSAGTDCAYPWDMMPSSIARRSLGSSADDKHPHHLHEYVLDEDDAWAQAQ
jgi:hypothetical protein